MNTKKLFVVVMTGATIMGCTASDFKNYKTVGAATGAAGGAVVGSLVGGTRTSTLIGAGIGTVAGLGWGHYLDKQEAELKQKMANSGASIERHGDELSVILPGGVTFATNSDRIDGNFKRPLIEMANVLNAYPESRIIVEGHTDSTGPYDYNMTLSRNRAKSVRDFLINVGQVDSGRVSFVGFGPDEPVADNNTEAGKRQNRRVEVKIMQMK